MNTVHISSKGQLVLPKAVRESQGMVQGAEVDISEVPGGVLLTLVRGPSGRSLSDLVGCADYRRRARSLQEMEATIRRGVRERT